MGNLCRPVEPLHPGTACAITLRMDSESSSIPLPRSWPNHVKSAFLQALGMAHMAMAHIRGRCAESPVAEVSITADNERLSSEVELLREELRIKDARMARIPARHRPRYAPADRLAILELKASRGWKEQQAASAFLISAATIAGWLKRVDEKGAGALVQVARPVNRYPDFVDHLVERLELRVPSDGQGPHCAAAGAGRAAAGGHHRYRAW